MGDFDGDRIDDVFLSTGATWWFSSGGQAEWRLLNRMPEPARDLRFGDFDGDGRTDVLAVHGARLDVSWAGASPWTLTWRPGASRSPTSRSPTSMATPARTSSPRTARNGHTPRPEGRGPIWPGPRGARASCASATSPPTARRTCLFIAANQWQIVRGGGTGAWEPLRPALTATVDGLVVADFDGDRFADVAARDRRRLALRPRRAGAHFVSLRRESQDQDIATLPVGRFDGDARDDVLVWSGRHLAIASGAATR